MKKNLLRNAIAAIVVAMVATLASCGDKNPASQVDDIVGEAEKNVAEEEIARLEKQMKEAAKMMEYEYAAVLRDQIIELRGKS